MKRSRGGIGHDNQYIFITYNQLLDCGGDKIFHIFMMKKCPINKSTVCYLNIGKYQMKVFILLSLSLHLYLSPLFLSSSLSFLLLSLTFSLFLCVILVRFTSVRDIFSALNCLHNNITKSMSVWLCFVEPTNHIGSNLCVS
jgi:hypothetical protein